MVSTGGDISVFGVPEVRQHAFWVPVDKNYYAQAISLKVDITPIFNILISQSELNQLTTSCS